METESNRNRLVLLVLQRIPQDRSKIEMDIAIKTLKEKIKYFKNITEDVLFELLQRSSIRSASHGELIIQENAVGDCMYIVLSGKVSVWRNDKQRDSLVPSEPVPAEGSLVTNIQSLGELIVELEAEHGDEFPSFGEVALIEDAERSASVVAASERVYLLQISRAVYQATVSAAFEGDYRRRQAFVAGSELFAAWAPKHRDQLTMALESCEYVYGDTVLKQADAANAIHFVMDGELSVQMNPDYHFYQYHNKLDYAMQRRVFGYSSYDDRLVKQRMPLNWRNKKLELLRIMTGEIIGDVECLLDLDTYMQTVIAVKQSYVLKLGMDHYRRLIDNKYPTTIPLLQENMVKHEISRYSHPAFHAIHKIPFQKFVQHKAHEIKRKLDLELGLTDKAPHPTMRRGAGQCINLTIPPRGVLINVTGHGTVFDYIRQKYHQSKTFAQEQRFQEMAKNKTANEDPVRATLLERRKESLATTTRPSSPVQSTRSTNFSKISPTRQYLHNGRATSPEKVRHLVRTTTVINTATGRKRIKRPTTAKGAY